MVEISWRFGGRKECRAPGTENEVLSTEYWVPSTGYCVPRTQYSSVGHAPLTTSRLMTEREFAISVVRRLREAGHEALWAGGCVRDELLGLAPDDYDVATNARPEEVSRLFRRTVAVGVSFGVVNVLGP